VSSAAKTVFHTLPRRDIRMTDTPAALKLGQTVPDFELTTFDPVTR